MPARNSTTASLTYNANTSTGIVRVSYTSSVDLMEAQAISAVNKEFLTGQGQTVVSGEAYYDQNDACISAMEADSVTPPASPRSVSLLLSTGMGISGTAWVSNFEASAGSNEVLRCTFELTFTGARSIT